MGIIEDKKKFRRTQEENNPLNPKGSPSKTSTNKFDIDKKTIKGQKSKS